MDSLRFNRLFMGLFDRGMTSFRLEVTIVSLFQRAVNLNCLARRLPSLTASGKGGMLEIGEDANDGCTAKR